MNISTRPPRVVTRSSTKGKTGVFVLEDNLGPLRKTVAQLCAQRVMVGVPAETAPREPLPGEKSAPINNATLAYLMETGVPEKNIPARPFLKPGVIKVKEQVVAGLKRAGQAALDGKINVMMRELNAVGIKAQAAVQLKITTGPFAPLAPATIAARARRGRAGAVKYLKQLKSGGSPDAALVKPLIDTGALRQAITYVIRKI